MTPIKLAFCAVLLAGVSLQAADTPPPLADALAAAATDAERTALLESRKAEVTAALSAVLVERARPLLQKDPAAALPLLEVARTVAERFGDRPQLARTLHALGQAHNVRDRLDLAEEAYRQSLALREELQDQAGLAETLGQLGVLRSKRGDYEGALVFYEKALPMAEAAGNKVEMATTLNNIGNAHNGRGEHEEALVFFARSAEAAEAASNKPRLAIALNNIGLVHSKQGDYRQALHFYQRSVDIKQELGNTIGVAITELNIGDLYRLQGNEALALRYFEKGLATFVAADMKAGIAMALNNEGEVYRRRGDFDRALPLYERSLAQSRTLKDKVGIAEALNSIGRLQHARGDYAAALASYQESLAHSEEAGDQVRIAQTLVNIAETHVARGEPAAAPPLVERAIAAAEPSGNRETSWRARTAAGRAFAALGQVDRARSAFEEAIATIEELRGQVAGGEAESAQAFEEMVAPYAAMVHLLSSSGQDELALRFAERAKARALLDVLRSGRTSATRTLAPREREQEARLEKALVSLNTQISAENARTKPDGTRLARLQARLQSARLDHEALQTALLAAHPELKVQRGEARLLDHADLEALLPDERTAIVEYVVADKSTLLFLGTRTAGKVALRSYVLPLGRRALAERVRGFRERIASRDLTSAAEARRLFDVVLGPAKAELRGRNRLVVVPDGPLWELPFQALQPLAGRYLIEDASVAYAPSLSVLREMRQAARPSAKRATLFALGNPALGVASIVASAAPSKAAPPPADVLMDSPLEPLPEAGRQVQALQRIYGPTQSDVFLGASATEERAKAAAGRYRVFHVATHGVLSNTSPMYSHVVLAQGAGGAEDGLLEAREILGLDLGADIAILSACDTGRGRIGSGEGVIGLTWALFVAGCPRTVVSQWKVESASTTALMVDFHQRLKPRLFAASGTLGAAESLRRAALSVMHDPRYRHPFYWAGFVLVGDGG